jgi:hypothetical protein
MDPIVELIFIDAMREGTSFTEGGLSTLFGFNKYSNRDMRDTWNLGIKHGIEIGLNRASLEGQRIELDANTPEGKNKESIKKFYALAVEYKCAIQYHPKVGMVCIDREYNY